MTVRKRLVVKLLLFVARLINDDDSWSKDLSQLETHVNLYLPKEEV